MRACACVRVYRREMGVEEKFLSGFAFEISLLDAYLLLTRSGKKRQRSPRIRTRTGGTRDERIRRGGEQFTAYVKSLARAHFLWIIGLRERERENNVWHLRSRPPRRRGGGRAQKSHWSPMSSRRFHRRNLSSLACATGCPKLRPGDVQKEGSTLLQTLHQQHRCTGFQRLNDEHYFTLRSLSWTCYRVSTRFQTLHT